MRYTSRYGVSSRSVLQKGKWGRGKRARGIKEDEVAASFRES